MFARLIDLIFNQIINVLPVMLIVKLVRMLQTLIAKVVSILSISIRKQTPVLIVVLLPFSKETQTTSVLPVMAIV